MRLKLKTAPTAEPITLEEAKNYLKIETADDNVLINALITSARQLGEKCTRRAFITQTWQAFFDSVSAEFEIPKPPLQSVESIKVLDEEGNETTVDSSYYDVDKSENSPGRVKLKSGCCWPTHRGFASFIVEFKAGYGDAADSVPQLLKLRILQLIGHLYDNRDSQEIPEEVQRLFASFKVYRL